MSTPTIEQQLSDILAALSVPPTADEEQSGWSQESKSAIHKYFSELKAAVDSGSQLPPLGVLRGLDHWGVVGGELFRSIAQVTNCLRESQVGKKL